MAQSKFVSCLIIRIEHQIPICLVFAHIFKKKVIGIMGYFRWNSWSWPPKSSPTFTHEKLRILGFKRCYRGRSRWTGTQDGKREKATLQGTTDTRKAVWQCSHIWNYHIKSFPPWKTYCFFSCLWPLLFGLPLSDPLLAFSVWGGENNYRL